MMPQWYERWGDWLWVACLLMAATMGAALSAMR